MVINNLQEHIPKNTRRTYGLAWNLFEEFCDLHGYVALPADSKTVVEFLIQQHGLGLSSSTLMLRLASINAYHVSRRHISPTKESQVRITLERLKQLPSNRKSNSKASLTLDLIRNMVGEIDTNTLRGKRDRAMLLYGFNAALRRSQIVAIDVEHIASSGRDHILHVAIPEPRKNLTIPIVAMKGSALCPVAAMENWIHSSGITSGPAFRRIFPDDNLGTTRLSDKTVFRLIKTLATRLCLDENDFGAQSLKTDFTFSAVDTSFQRKESKLLARNLRVDSLNKYEEKRDMFFEHAGENIEG